MNHEYPLLLETLSREKSLTVDVVTQIINDLIRAQADVRELTYALRPFALGEFDEADLGWARELLEDRKF